MECGRGFPSGLLFKAELENQDLSIPNPGLTPSCLGSQEASARTLTAYSEARKKRGPGRAIRSKLGFASFSGPREPLLSGPQPREMRCGLKGAVISFTVSSVGASCISQHCQGAALDPGFPGSLGGPAGASLLEPRGQTPQGRSNPLLV